MLQHKCEQYWSDSEAKTYGNVLVEKVDEDEYADFTIRTFHLTQVSDPYNKYALMDYLFACLAE